MSMYITKKSAQRSAIPKPLLPHGNNRLNIRSVSNQVNIVQKIQWWRMPWRIGNTGNQGFRFNPLKGGLTIETGCWNIQQCNLTMVNLRFDRNFCLLVSLNLYFFILAAIRFMLLTVMVALAGSIEHQAKNGIRRFASAFMYLHAKPDCRKQVGKNHKK